MKAISVIFLGLLLAGCVTSSDSSDDYSESYASTDPEIRCKMEKPTGSNRREKVCRRVGTDVDREQTKRDMQTLQRQSEVILGPPD